MPIAQVSSFKRMREFNALGVPWVAEALKTSAALEVDETNTKVRRRTEVTEPKGQFERSIYAVSMSANVPGARLFILAPYRKDSARRCRVYNKSWRRSSTSMDEQMPYACAVWTKRSCSRYAAHLR